MPTVELINTGSELLLGYVMNTHVAYLAQKLSPLGLEIARQVCVGDEPKTLRSAFADALRRSDIILSTGGLGPTKDDRTRDIVAKLTGKKLWFDPEVMLAIKQRFAGREMPRSVRVQAMVPEGARTLPNTHGTAPGLVLRYKRTLMILLPGPPRELKPMFEEQVLPFLRKKFRCQERECRTLRVTGLGESVIEERVIRATQGIKNLELGYCARMGEVDIRIVTRGRNAKRLAEKAESRVRKELGHHVFGTTDDSMEKVVVQLLAKRRKTVAVAESCTGGVIAHRLTNISGSSQVFRGGIVAYSNAVKVGQVGVSKTTLSRHGAVSKEVARELAQGVRKKLGTSFGLGVTGIAGPLGGTPGKPVGLVFIALATLKRTICRRHIFKLDRETFKFVTSQTALDLLRRELKAESARA